MTETTVPAVEAAGIHKRFGSTYALRGVDLSLLPGHCLGLVGRNGAGKSTLVSILSGILTPDAGQVLFDGQPAPSDTAGWRGRIATVFQHSMVVPSLTVAENVFLGTQPGKAGFVDWRDMRARTRSVMAEWGFDVNASAPCGSLTVEQRQIVEIVRALAAGARCLLLDEPTAALERGAVQRLFERIRQLRQSGVAILYISHHLEEVFEICTEAAVLRDGELVLSAPLTGLSKDDLVTAMVGQIQYSERPHPSPHPPPASPPVATQGPMSSSDAPAGGPERASPANGATGGGTAASSPRVAAPGPVSSSDAPAAGAGPAFLANGATGGGAAASSSQGSPSAASGVPGAPAGTHSTGAGGTATATGAAALTVTGITLDSPGTSLRNVSLTVRPGERVGITGLRGSGATTLARIVAGAAAPDAGSVRLGDRPLRPGDRADALRAGVGYIPEDRQADGFVPQLGVAENITMAIVDRLARFGLVSPRRREARAAPLARRLSLVSAGLGQPVGELSGGNQQKVTVARALARDPKLIVAITPTRGVDVASKELLLGELDRAAAAAGASLLLATDELDDLVICDRVIVLVRGEIFTEFTEPPFDRERLIAATEGMGAAA